MIYSSLEKFFDYKKVPSTRVVTETENVSDEIIDLLNKKFQQDNFPTIMDDVLTVSQERKLQAFFGMPETTEQSDVTGDYDKFSSKFIQAFFL